MKKLFNKFSNWLIARLKHNRLILLLSVITGILSAFAAIALKNCFYYTNKLIIYSFSLTYLKFLLLISPIIGLLLTYFFIKYFIKEDIGHGVSKILSAISTQNSKIKPHNSFSSIIASTLTIGFGGSVGAEAPIALTGSSLGSNIGKLFKLDHKDLTLLIACGAAGAISAIFKAPIAGFIFTLEVLMLDLTMASVLPLLLSSVTATILTNFLMGHNVLFSFAITEQFNINDTFFYIFLGILSGLFSLFFTRTSYFIEAKFLYFNNPFYKIFFGGIILSVLIFAFPPLYGEGYLSLKNILSGNYQEFILNFFSPIKNNYWFFIIYLFILIFLKVIAMAFTNSAGGIGGVFAPSLFCGGI